MWIIVAYAVILAIFVNLSISRSMVIGVIASIVYFLINGVFLAQMFSKRESLFSSLVFGMMLLIALLGLVSWLIMIIYNLDIVRSVIALCLVTTVASAVKLRTESIPWRLKRIRIKFRLPTPLEILSLLYLLMIFFSFYLLLLSRSGEAYTVWEVIHPAFIPVFFVTTVLIFALVFSSIDVKFKLLFIVTHSIICHTLFVIVFPAGDLSGQQLTLGKSRLVYDNVVMHGIGWPQESILSQIYYWFKGYNFQAALSVIFARMFAIDILWVHLLLVPVLSSTFFPVITFIVTKAIGKDETVAALAGILVSVFPNTVFWGAISVENSLGFIFFYGSLCFFLKYLFSKESKGWIVMMTFSFVSFLAHFLTGIMSFSFLLLGMSLQRYESNKITSPTTTKMLLFVPLIFCAVLLPFALIYLKIFHPTYTYFSLAKMNNLPAMEIVLLFLFGRYIYYSPQGVLISVFAPVLGFLGMMYVLKERAKKTFEKIYGVRSLFLMLGFLIILVDYRILNFLLVGVPFREERLWMFRDMLAVPFLAVMVNSIISFLTKTRLPFLTRLRWRVNISRVVVYGLTLVFLAGWTTASVYTGYPQYGPLQTTSYELEAVKYIEKTTSQRYIVVCDQWMIFAGEILVGFANPRAYYFSSKDPQGVTLFLKMKDNPSNDTLTEAMKYNNSTVAYFIIEKPRLGTETYNLIIDQAQQSGLQTYQTFSYQGEEKLHIFYYKEQ